MDRFDYSTTDTIAIANEIARTHKRFIELQAEIGGLRNHFAVLSSRLQQLIGTPTQTGEEVLRSREGNVKRAVTQVLRDLKARGWTPDDARGEAIKRAEQAAHDHGLPGPSDIVLHHLDQKVREIFGSSHRSGKMKGVK